MHAFHFLEVRVSGALARAVARRSTMTTPAAAEERELASAFAARVRELRVRKGLSQAQLARAAGLSASWVHRVETAPRTITLALIQRLCSALAVTHGELLGNLPQLTQRHTRANRQQ